MDSFLDLRLLGWDGYQLTVGMLLGAISTLLLTRLLEMLFGRIMQRLQLREKLPIPPEQIKTWVRVFRTLFWLPGIFLAFKWLAIDLRDLLNFTLFSIPYKEGAAEVKVTNILIVFLIVAATRLGVWYLYRLFVHLGDNKRVPTDQGRRVAVYQVFKYVIYGVAFILILTNLHINLDLLIASSAALFLGVGLAMQHTFEDIVSGIIILFEGTVEVGDMVEVDSLKLEGRVTEIRLRSSIVETLDSVSVIVPNSRFIRSNVINWTFNDRKTRFHIPVSVAYGSDVQLVRKVLRNSAISHGLILKYPEPRVRFTDFGDSGLQFELLFWTNRSAEYLEIMSDLRFKIDAEFRRNQIQIPFPQRDLHIISDQRPPAPTELGRQEETGKKGTRENGLGNI